MGHRCGIADTRRTAPRVVGWLIRSALWLALLVAASATLGAGTAKATVPDLWLRAVTDPASRDEALADLEAERSRGAYGDVGPLATGLMAEAHRASDPRSAEAWATLAVAAAPGDPRPRAFLARFYIAEVFRPASALANAWQWIRAVVQDPWGQSTALFWSGAALTLSAWFAVTALVVVGMAVCGSVLFHDYRDSFPRGFRRHVPVFLSLLVGAVLWTVGTGPAVFVLLLGVALSPYLPGRARWALAVLLAVGCFLPQGFGGLAGLGEAPGDRAWAMYRVWRGDADPGLQAELTQLFPDQDARVLFAKARVARRNGNYGEGEQYLERALALPGVPTWMLRTELGTLRFASGDAEGALGEFQRASEAAPSAALPWLGLHVVHLERLELAEADEALEQARALGGRGIDSAQRKFTESSRHIAPVPPNMPPSWIRDELLGGHREVVGWTDALTRGLFLPVNTVHPAAFALLGLGVILAGGRSGAGRRSRRCPKCGFVVCPRCGRRVKGTDLCPACWADSHEAAADNAERERHLRIAEKWQAASERWRRVGLIALPGWSGFLRSGRIGDLLLGLAWAGAAGVLALQTFYPISLLPWGQTTFPWIAAAVLLGSHAMGLRQMTRRPA